MLWSDFAAVGPAHRESCLWYHPHLKFLGFWFLEIDGRADRRPRRAAGRAQQRTTHRQDDDGADDGAYHVASLSRPPAMTTRQQHKMEAAVWAFECGDAARR
eukprot:scaffold137973_cov479-Phaeocystis_antarctica.AAC.1